MDETHNVYMSSRGIMKCCDIRSLTPISSIRKMINYDFQKLKSVDDNTVISFYVCSSAIKFFYENILNKIPCKFILVSGDCDESMPFDVLNKNEFECLINHNLLKHWFCQNFIIKHKKVTLMPIGLDYHTMATRNIWGPLTSCMDQEKLLCLIKKQSKPFNERLCKCYCNFHFLMTTKYGYDRKDAIRLIPKEVCHYEENKVARLKTWKHQSEYAFVVSPHGNGYDCHRTWEAIHLGCIPIVKSSKIDELYKDLPVLIVNEWDEVTNDLLKSTVDKFTSMSFDYKKLELEYWKEKVNKYKHSSIV